MAKLHDYYKDEVVAKLMTEFNYNSVMQVPRVEKITLNMGVGEAIADKKLLDNAAADLTAISGQKPLTGGDTAIVVTTTGFAVFFQQRSKRFALVQLWVNHFNDVATTRRCRFTFNNCHCITPPTYSAPPTKSRFWPSFRVT